MADRMNRYAPPTAPIAGSSRGTLGYAYLKWVYLGSLIAPVFLSFLAAGANAKERMPLLAILLMLVTVAGTGASLLWLFKTWSLVPEKRRRGVTPAAAVVYNFVPGFNLWWAFAANERIARSLNEKLLKYPTRVRAPTVLAWLAPLLVTLFGLVMGAMMVKVINLRGSEPPAALTMVLPLLGLSPFAWFAWMLRVDACHQEIFFQRNEKRARKEKKERRDARERRRGSDD